FYNVGHALQTNCLPEEARTHILFKVRPHRLMVRTWPSQGRNTGSTPVGAIFLESGKSDSVQISKTLRSPFTISAAIGGMVVVSAGGLAHSQGAQQHHS